MVHHDDASEAIGAQTKARPERGITIGNGAPIDFIGAQGGANARHVHSILVLLQKLDVNTANDIATKHAFNVGGSKAVGVGTEQGCGIAGHQGCD